MNGPTKFKLPLEQQLQFLDIANGGTSEKLLAESCMEQAKMQGVGYTSIFEDKFRDALMLKMERLLYIWIADLDQKRMPYNEINVEVKALSLYKDLKNMKGNGKRVWFPFTFSKEWFAHLKLQTGVHSLRLLGDSDGADKEAAARYPEKLSAILEKNNYKDEQIFNVDDISFFWKKLPSHTYLVSDENSCHGSGYFKTSNEQLTILLGGNAAGDFKLKPMIVCPSQDSHTFYGVSKNELPVIANKLAWFTKTKFEQWFTNYFCPATERYCQEKGLDHKILLILDNAPGHKMITINKNVQVIYTPTNTAPLLQPMDQGIFAIFKGNYLRQIFLEAIKETSAENGPSLVEYWKNYNIKHAVKNIRNAWDELTISQLKGVWKHILPHRRGGNDNDFNVNSNLNEIAKNILELGQKLGFDEKHDCENVLECINLNTIELDNQALLNIMTYNGDKDRNELTIAQLEKIYIMATNLKQFIAVNDPNKERITLVTNGVNESIRCYKDMWERKKIEKDNQQWL